MSCPGEVRSVYGCESVGGKGLGGLGRSMDNACGTVGRSRRRRRQVRPRGRSLQQSENTTNKETRGIPTAPPHNPVTLPYRLIPGLFYFPLEDEGIPRRFPRLAPQTTRGVLCI